MRQVPIAQMPFQAQYSLIGSGRLAKHLSHYFKLLKVPHNIWSRSSEVSLESVVSKSNIILLAISDNALKSFVDINKEILKDKVLVHFSGASIVDGVFSAHPLMTFSKDLYDLETYQEISFICDEKTSFKEIFPQLENKSFKVSEKDKAYYHSLIVMAGNFPQILWSEIQKGLSQKLDLPPEIINGYISQVAKNHISNPKNSLTGPLVRNDTQTIDSHLKALNPSNLKPIYESFLNLYRGGL